MTEPAPAFRDPTLPLDERVLDLVARLRLDEKMRLLHHENPAVERLGIPAYAWWNEACHGVARAGRATVFPQCIGLAATFDPELIRSVYRTVAVEARAGYAAAARAGKRGRYRGLTFWTPNINIFRDPRWGRGQETFGEDPHLTAVLGVAVVRGLQGDDPERLDCAACAKHLAVHSGPEGTRHSFDAHPSRQDLHETYLPAFEALVRAGVEAVMGAYNRLYGEPCCASPFLLDEVLRGRFGFKGHVVSDCWALLDFHEYHGVTGSAAESAALALRNGCDLNCGCAYEALPAALETGLVSEADVDRSLRRLLRTRFRLGQFDETEEDLAEMVAAAEGGESERRALARRAAAASVTLVRNDGVLPIAKDGLSLFVTGPQAASVDVLLGNYCGTGGRLTTVLEGIAGAVGPAAGVQYQPGCLVDESNRNALDWATGSARDADVVIAVAGLDPRFEGEEGDAIATPFVGDREDIGLPRSQVDYLTALTEQSETPVVLVVTGGSPIALGDLAGRCAAILYCWYPGEAGGEAVADVLFGDVAPAGRLPVTVPRSVEDLPPFDDYSMEGRTYRFLAEEPLYPFGFGLSYTRFAYEDLELSKDRIGAGEEVAFEVSVRNAGGRDADEVVQVYLTDEEASVRVPTAKLVAFRRVRVAAGESAQLSFTLAHDTLGVVLEDGTRLVEPGEFTLLVGGCSPGARGVQLGAPEPAAARFLVD